MRESAGYLMQPAQTGSRPPTTRWSPSVWLVGLVVCLALVSSVTLKVGVRLRSPVSVIDVRTPITNFLQQHNLRLATVTGEPGSLKIAATSGWACRIQIIEAQPRGYNYDSLRQTAGPADDFFVLFGGLVYDEQPLWWTKADYYWARFKREIGIPAAPRPVLAIIASSACSARTLPWHNLL